MCTRHHFNVYAIRTAAFAVFAINFLSPLTSMFSGQETSAVAPSPDYSGYTFNVQAMKMDMNIGGDRINSFSFQEGGYYVSYGGPECILRGIYDPFGAEVPQESWESILTGLVSALNPQDLHLD